MEYLSLIEWHYVVAAGAYSVLLHAHAARGNKDNKKIHLAAYGLVIVTEMTMAIWPLMAPGHMA